MNLEISIQIPHIGKSTQRSYSKKTLPGKPPKLLCVLLAAGSEPGGIQNTAPAWKHTEYGHCCRNDSTTLPSNYFTERKVIEGKAVLFCFSSLLLVVVKTTKSMSPLTVLLPELFIPKSFCFGDNCSHQEAAALLSHGYKRTRKLSSHSDNSRQGEV